MKLYIKTSVIPGKGLHGPCPENVTACAFTEDIQSWDAHGSSEHFILCLTDRESTSATQFCLFKDRNLRGSPNSSTAHIKIHLERRNISLSGSLT